MINYRIEAVEQNNKWNVSIFANSDFVVQYVGIDSKDDAYLAAGAFIDGLKMGKGE